MQRKPNPPGSRQSTNRSPNYEFHFCSSQRLKSVLLRSVRENSDSPLLASQQGKKRAYADVEALSPVAGTNEGQEKRQKAVPVASAGAGVDGLSKLRMALAQARTVLKAA